MRAHQFRGYVPADSFTTSKGFRGNRLDTLWSQFLIQSMEKDDRDLAEIAMSSSLAEADIVVDGGYNGSPYGLGEYGFYANNQFSGIVEEAKIRTRKIVQRSLFMTEGEWREIDNHLEEIIRHTTARFDRVVRGDTVPSLAVRENAYDVATFMLYRHTKLFITNEADETLIDIARQQCGVLNIQLRQRTVITQALENTFQTPSQRKEQQAINQTLLSNIQGMIRFLRYLQGVLIEKRGRIESEAFIQKKAELRKQVANPSEIENFLDQDKIHKAIQVSCSTTYAIIAVHLCSLTACRTQRSLSNLWSSVWLAPITSSRRRKTRNSFNFRNY